MTQATLPSKSFGPQASSGVAKLLAQLFAMTPLAIMLGAARGAR